MRSMVKPFTKIGKYTRTHHIIFDGFGVNSKLLVNERFILNLLLEIPSLIKMKIMAGPNLIRDYNKHHEGITGFAIVNFSHISIHTFSKTQEIYVDVFSCKPFDSKKVQNYLVKMLSPKQMERLEVKYPWERENKPRRRATAKLRLHSLHKTKGRKS